MNFARRPERIALILIGLSIAVAITAGGCNNRGGPVAKKDGTGSANDAVAVALNQLERANDADSCRAVLQQIDSIGNPHDPKPQPTSEQLAALGQLLKLESDDWDTLTQQVFTAVDGEYLAESLLLRDAMQSLDLKDLPPLQQAESAFAWICRQIYTSDSLHPLAPSWWVLQAGSASGMDRAYVFLDVMRQLGLDGCLIGPPDLARIRSIFQSGNQLHYAPIRAVGVRVGADIYLFNPWLGKPILAKGKTATLVQVRADNSLVADLSKNSSIKPDESAKWEVWLAQPFSALAPRMEWLERQMKASNPVRLHADLVGMHQRFTKDLPKEIPCRVWNPTNDSESVIWLREAFFREEKDATGALIQRRKNEFYRSHFPEQAIPKLYVGNRELGGEPKTRLLQMFAMEFEPVLMKHNSARDHLLRGNFSNASNALTDQKDRNERARDRIAQERDLEKAVGPWAEEALNVFSNVQRAQLSGDPAELARANQAQNDFLKTPLSQRVAMLLRKKTSLLLRADASYHLALLMQERAERAALRQLQSPDDKKKEEALSLWRNAVGSWQRYLDNYPELRVPSVAFPDRDAHARELHERCKTQLETNKKP